MWTPTHVVVTVTKGRNLLEKGKGGNDAYCMIGMGKEKFLTSVKTKTLSPVWDEQAEFQLGEREDLKITVYHKSSIIDEFVGRVLINIADLASQDNNHSYTNWFKLGGKPEKSEKSKKQEKERGEIEVRIDFVIKPKAGSMMDLSLKSKEKSLSLRNLKEKMSIKGSISDKFSKLKKSGQPKYSGENQLADQAKRMGGSKLDFLEGDDIGSIASSYSSINGPTLIRTGGNGQMSRFNQGRQSFLSRASSQGPQNDSSSIYGNDTSRNDEDFDEHFKTEENESDRDSLNSSTSFQRRNSSRFGSAISRNNISRKKPSTATSNTNENMNSTENEKNNDEENTGGESGIYIAPLQLFNENTSTPQLTPRNRAKNSSHDTKTSDKKIRHKTSSSVAATIDEENILSLKSPVQPTPQQAADFAAIFAESLTTDAKSPEREPGRSIITDPFEKSQSKLSVVESSPSSSKQKKNAPVAIAKSNQKDEAPKPVPTNPFLDDCDEVIRTKKSSNPFLDEDDAVKKKKAPGVPILAKNATNINNYPMINDEEDNIEWDSSEDEEIVKKEVASFERNQVPNKPTQSDIYRTDKVSEHLATNSSQSVQKKSFTKILPPVSSVIKSSENLLFSSSADEFNSDKSSSQVNLSRTTINHQKLPDRNFPTASTFSIDLDPFSSSSSSSIASFKDIQAREPLTTPFADPFGLSLFDTNLKDVTFNKQDPFSSPDTKPVDSFKMAKIDDIPALNFSNVDDLDGTTAFDAPPDLEIEELEIDNENIDDAFRVHEIVESASSEAKENTEGDEQSESTHAKSDEECEDADSQDESRNELSQEPDFGPSFLNSRSKKQSYDTIQSLNLDGDNSRKNTGDSEDLAPQSEATTKFTLHDAVETETSTDTFSKANEEKPTMRPSFTKVMPSKTDDRKGSLQEDRKSSRQFDRKSSLQNIKINFDEEDDNTNEIKTYEETIDEEEQAEENVKENVEDMDKKSTLTGTEERKPFITIKRMMRQSERRRLAPVEDLTSDLNSETDFNHSTASISSSVRNRPNKLKSGSSSNNVKSNSSSDASKSQDFDRAFQDQINDKKSDIHSVQNGLPDLINQKGTKDGPTDKARKYLEGMDGVKFNEIQVPDTLKKQLEYFDRDELLQLIAYQKKYLDFKETRIKDLENYIDNLVVKIIETEPTILMNASNVLTKPKNFI